VIGLVDGDTMRNVERARWLERERAIPCRGGGKSKNSAAVVMLS